MRTQKQIEAARRNGAKSRGPVTPEGKARSAQNRRIHGLSGNVVVLQNESDDAFTALRDSYAQIYAPANAAEANLVMHIASAQWRLQRCIVMETAAMDHEMDRQRADIAERYVTMDEPTRTMLAFTSLVEEGPGLTALDRYETRLQRTIQRASAELRELQKLRREAEAAEQPAAAENAEPEAEAPTARLTIIPFEPKDPEIPPAQPLATPGNQPTGTGGPLANKPVR
jgi:hypothetical protein